MSSAGRIAGLAGAAVGLVAMGAAAGNVAERRLLGRLAAPREPTDVPLGSLRGTALPVTTADGLTLHAEVDDADGSDAATVVFVHGYALNLDYWHFQRLALRGQRRLVLFDQRSHGRSQRAPKEATTIEWTGDDLRRVLEETVPEGPVVLVGHSMGGMTIMALAQQAPALFAERVAAVALMGTSAGDLGEVSLGPPGLAGRALRRVAPGVLAVAARAPRLVESGRRAGSDLGYLVTGRCAFGGEVAPAVVEFADEMLASTPVDVVAEFFPDFVLHDRYDVLAAMRDVHTLVLCGTKDLITPVEHSRLIAERLPSTELVELEGVGHLANLERPTEVNRALEQLLRRADAEGAA